LRGTSLFFLFHSVLFFLSFLSCLLFLSRSFSLLTHLIYSCILFSFSFHRLILLELRGRLEGGNGLPWEDGRLPGRQYPTGCVFPVVVVPIGQDDQLKGSMYQFRSVRCKSPRMRFPWVKFKPVMFTVSSQVNCPEGRRVHPNESLAKS
jgi:hypothetical protein